MLNILRCLSALSLCVPIIAFAQAAADFRINGSDTVEPLIEAAVAQFKKTKPNVAISLEAKGTSTGFAALCDGKTDIAMASRAITVKEMQLCKSRGVAFIEIPVAWDAVVIVANRNDGWLRDMSLAELRLLWGTESTGKKLTWNQVRSNYPATPVTLFGLDQKSGTFDFFSGAISGIPKVMRADYQETAEHAIVIDRVSKTPGAIGYVSLAIHADHAGKVAALALDEGNGPVHPSTQTVVNGQYAKMSRLLFVYVSKASYDARPNVREFASFLVEGASRFAPYARFVPLMASNYQEQSLRLKRGDVGSMYTK
jgi:phosphate transport system substrate-binding protein